MERGLLSAACILIILMSCKGIFSADCPPLNSLECYRAHYGCRDGRTRMSSVIKLGDGTRCPGCKVCVSPEHPCYGMACPMWQVPDDCTPDLYTLYLNVSGTDCQICDTYRCL